MYEEFANKIRTKCWVIRNGNSVLNIIILFRSYLHPIRDDSMHQISPASGPEQTYSFCFPMNK